MAFAAISSTLFAQDALIIQSDTVFGKISEINPNRIIISNQKVATEVVDQIMIDGVWKTKHEYFQTSPGQGNPQDLAELMSSPINEAGTLIFKSGQSMIIGFGTVVVGALVAVLVGGDAGTAIGFITTITGTVFFLDGISKLMTAGETLQKVDP